MRKTLPLVAAWMVFVAALAQPAGAAAPSRCPGSDGAPTEVVTGTFGKAEEGAYVLVPFSVVEGSTRVRVKICYDQPESPTNSRIRHTLDLGVYQPTADGFYDAQEFRGWGGSSRPNVLITPEEATLGFLPGPTPAGEWAAEIGVAAVAGQLEGDSDGKVAWRLEIFVGSDPADLDTPWQPTPYSATAARSEPGWYKGDFHVHAEHSNPSGATMEHTFDYAFGDRPQGAGLDFITLSDYVTTRHWHEIGRFQADYPGKLIMRSAEIITYRGHINNHVSGTWADYRTGPIYELRDGDLTEVRGPTPPSDIFNTINDAGGFTQVNHPTTFDSDVPTFGNFCRGCSWEYTDEETQWDVVDAMEIQTGPSGTPDPDGHELGPNPFTPLAIDWWDSLRTRGFDITAVGSSDSHDADHEELTQSPIGEATTVVYADELSEEGIQRGIEAGHAYVKFFSSDGPDLRFEAQALESPGRGNGKGRPKAMMGDSLPVGAAEFEATVLGAAPSPEPRLLLIMKDGKPIEAWPVVSNEFTIGFTADVAGDYRLQLMRGSAIEALSNPITLDPN